ncbi:conserved hypothetical protein [Desulfatibacillum aliphaticivorans]|uniref:Uncharacterized protein n=1 Tax=Desulfatibacillum aliphaticivorans TaxID=218208 RepID=B8FAB0_DESAL|nr:hypothetical protein [Desulfatibacillum aliphaticivorans]ACL03206.1 conserved hypothetical protein [Desulfatibacillum aliphaticivorans]
MPKISMTDFVDFVVKAGSPKMTKVRQVRDRGGYNPAHDFWRLFRNDIVEFHQNGFRDKKRFDRLLGKLTDHKKQKRYPEAIKGYKKFLGRKNIEWFTPPKELWSHSGLDVRVNPELGLVINGDRFIIKLYFKDEKLTKYKVPVIGALMISALASECDDSDKFAILDVSNSKLITFEDQVADVMPLLAGEAYSFISIWDAL